MRGRWGDPGLAAPWRRTALPSTSANGPLPDVPPKSHFQVGLPFFIKRPPFPELPLCANPHFYWWVAFRRGCSEHASCGQEVGGLCVRGGLLHLGGFGEAFPRGMRFSAVGPVL